ncbi:MAG: ATP-binding cassette domain-containing protein, partial [Pseudonocardiaceae bacterium]
MEVRHLSVAYDGIPALRGATLEVREGEIVALVGPNGAGKSTLMNVLYGLYGPTEGQVLVNGEPVTFKNPGDAIEAAIGMVHQHFMLVPVFTVTENVMLGVEPTRNLGLLDKRAARDRLIELSQKYGLKVDPDALVEDLPVGVQQRVEILKALTHDAKVLILDEPTAALNDEDSAHLLNLLRGLRDDGITSVIISHKLNEIVAIADSVTILRDGRTVEMLDMRTGPVGEDRIIAGMVGRDLSDRFPPREPAIGEEVLRIEDWTVHSPTQHGRVVVSGASLMLRRGEIVGLAGLMGAGRTELAMSVFGRSYGASISGRVFKHGREIHLRTVRD